MKKSNITNWVVLVNPTFDYVAIELLKLIHSKLTNEDLFNNGGWQKIGSPAFGKAEDAIKYCQQMDFKPVIKKKKKRIQL